MSDSVYIFDFDKTICDLVVDWSEWHQGLGRIFSQFVPGFDLHLKGQKVHEYQNIYIRKYGRNLRDKIAVYNSDYEKKYITGFIPHPEVISKIKSLSEKKYLWTANSRSTISVYLPKIDLERDFISWVTRDEIDFIKPDPQGFDLINNPKINLSRYIFIGDSPDDRNAAVSAGISFIHVSDFV